MDKVTESRLVFAHLATLGLLLIGLYDFAPFMLDEGVLPGWEKASIDVGTWANKIPWVKVAAFGSLIPYGVMLSRRIPKKVIEREDRKGVVESPDWEDVVGKNSFT